MKIIGWLRNLPLMITVGLNILLFLAIFVLMNYVQQLLDSDAKINLSEVVTQNKDVITSKLMLEINTLELTANQLAERMTMKKAADYEDMRAVFLEYCKDKPNNQLSWAFADGRAVFNDGREFDVSGRRYFRLAMEGVQNISDRTVSRLDGEDIFVISVPVLYNGARVGTVQKMYTPHKMYQICSLSLFSEKGYMYIINSQGYILMSSHQEEYNRESDNYFRMLYQENYQSAKLLEEDIKNHRAGFVETTADGKNFFSAYTPIDKVYDWYLISTIDTAAVSSNGAIVIKLFYAILSVTVLIFGCSMLYFFRYKNKQQDNLKRIAFVDTVTQGNTYNKFDVELQTTLQSRPGVQFHFFVFDIDNFKYINQFYGFDFGDRLLYCINQLITQKLHQGEFMARIYSDHFVVLLEDASKHRLESFLAEVTDIEGITIYFSAGVYTITNPDESVNLMLDKANIAAQEIKGIPHKRIEFYSENFAQRMVHNEQLKRAVEKALAADEFVPFYQPKVDINTGKLVGAEALARWITKEGKMISPGDFIPVCEKTGLIVDLDMVIFEKALQFLRMNIQKGLHCVPISVNFSRLHFLNNHFLQSVLEKLHQYEVPPHLVELELTETVIFDNHDMIVEFVERMHEHGLLISMDDFGSGYSSLNMLKDICIDVIKIDRGFIEGTLNSERQRAIFSAITQMAAQLQIKVVVEGVENIENVMLMREFGCSIAQGYYYARPMKSAEFEKIYEEGTVC